MIVKISPLHHGGAPRRLEPPPVLPENAVILWGWKATVVPKRQEPRGCRFIAEKCERYPIGGKWRFCQQPQVEGSSYCQRHALVCYKQLLPGAP